MALPDGEKASCSHSRKKSRQSACRGRMEFFDRGDTHNAERRAEELVSLLPMVAHESAGMVCCGCMIANEQGNDMIRSCGCNECGAVLGVVNTAILMDLISLIPATSPRRSERKLVLSVACGDRGSSQRPSQRAPMSQKPTSRSLGYISVDQASRLPVDVEGTYREHPKRDVRNLGSWAHPENASGRLECRRGWVSCPRAEAGRWDRLLEAGTALGIDGFSFFEAFDRQHQRFCA